jgi:hypothetical protein
MLIQNEGERFKDKLRGETTPLPFGKLILENVVI